eukprot:scaffold90781_cov57-Phaeocystis_antarctica.AAC.1
MAGGRGPELGPLPRLRATMGARLRPRHLVALVLLLCLWAGQTRLDGDAILCEHGKLVLLPRDSGRAGGGGWTPEENPHPLALVPLHDHLAPELPQALSRHAHARCPAHHPRGDSVLDLPRVRLGAVRVAHPPVGHLVPFARRRHPSRANSSFGLHRVAYPRRRGGFVSAGRHPPFELGVRLEWDGAAKLLLLVQLPQAAPRGLDGRAALCGRPVGARARHHARAGRRAGRAGSRGVSRRASRGGHERGLDKESFERLP